MGSTMIIHPDHCDAQYLADMLKAIPPKNGEVVSSWLSRTNTILEGDGIKLVNLFNQATILGLQNFVIVFCGRRGMDELLNATFESVTLH